MSKWLKSQHFLWTSKQTATILMLASAPLSVDVTCVSSYSMCQQWPLINRLLKMVDRDLHLLIESVSTETKRENRFSGCSPSPDTHHPSSHPHTDWAPPSACQCVLEENRGNNRVLLGNQRLCTVRMCDNNINSRLFAKLTTYAQFGSFSTNKSQISYAVSSWTQNSERLKTMNQVTWGLMFKAW